MLCFGDIYRSRLGIAGDFRCVCPGKQWAMNNREVIFTRRAANGCREEDRVFVVYGLKSST